MEKTAYFATVNIEIIVDRKTMVGLVPLTARLRWNGQISKETYNSLAKNSTAHYDYCHAMDEFYALVRANCKRLGVDVWTVAHPTIFTGGTLGRRLGFY